MGLDLTGIARGTFARWPKRETRSAKILIGLSPSEKALFEKTAKDCNVSLSELMRASTWALVHRCRKLNDAVSQIQSAPSLPPEEQVEAVTAALQDISTLHDTPVDWPSTRDGVMVRAKLEAR